MNKKNIIIVTIIFAVAVELYSSINVGDQDKLITDIYLKNAYGQLEAGNYEKAFSLSNIALSFNNGNSDALYIRSISGRVLALDIDPKEDLSDAIIKGDWKYYNEIFARANLSKYLFFDGDIEDAYLNLQPFGSKLASNSEISELYIRLSISVGRIDEALSIAENRLRVEPYDSYSQLILSMYNASWLEQAKEILMKGDPSEYISKEAFQYIIRNESECGFLNELYFRRWGEDRFYLINNSCKNPDLLQKLLYDLYPDKSTAHFRELMSLYILFDDDELKKLILNWLSSINITILYDNNRDGFNDTVASYNKGHLTSFKHDRNNDGSYDFIVTLDKTPLSLELITPYGHDYFYYKNYPNLIKVIKSYDKMSVEFQLIPYKLSLDIISLPKDFTSEIPYILQDIIFPDDNILTSSSTRRIQRDINDDSVSQYSIIDLDETMEEVYNSDGIKIVERHYKKSILITVFKDLDNDGVFDTIYEYKDAILQKISFDDNNNGIPEYTENYENGFVRSWDFNEDGIMDSTESTENGTINRELSVNPAGSLDNSMQINGNPE